jgi:hypothetical protein
MVMHPLGIMLPHDLKQNQKLSTLVSQFWEKIITEDIFTVGASTMADTPSPELSVNNALPENSSSLPNGLLGFEVAATDGRFVY